MSVSAEGQRDDGGGRCMAADWSLENSRLPKSPATHIMCCVSAFESSNQNSVFYQFFLST